MPPAPTATRPRLGFAPPMPRWHHIGILRTAATGRRNYAPGRRLRQRLRMRMGNHNRSCRRNGGVPRKQPQIFDARSCPAFGKARGKPSQPPRRRRRELVPGTGFARFARRYPTSKASGRSRRRPRSNANRSVPGRTEDQGVQDWAKYGSFCHPVLCVCERKQNVSMT